mgnify:CR=1 FL=1
MIFNPKIAFMGAARERVVSEWFQFGKNAAHNMVVEQAPVGSSPKMYELALYSSISDYSLMYTVMHTLDDGKAYAYHINQASDSTTAFLYCFVCGEGTFRFAKPLSGTPGVLAAPFLEEEAIWVCERAKLRRYSGIHKQLILDKELSLDGPGSTPITKLGDCLYVGTDNGHYYQIDPETMDYKVFSVEDPFIGSGAVSDGTNVYFGSDNGLLYWRSIADFDTTGGVLDLTDVASDAGNVRSTVMMDEDGFLYFTTQGGYLWCCFYDGGLKVYWNAKLGATSTSTPTKVGDRIYVGYYSGFSAGGVQCVTVSFDEEENVVTSVAPVASGFPVQGSIVVMGDGTGTDYLYFNTNAHKGAGYCYSFDGAIGRQVWRTNDGTYGLDGMAIDGGYVVFGDDFNIHIVSDRS